MAQRFRKWKSRYTTEYDVEGRVVAGRSFNSDASEWVTRYTYDASGNLLKVAYGNVGRDNFGDCLLPRFARENTEY